MPYINELDRFSIEAGVLSEDGRAPATPGELNFAITKLIDEYLLKTGLGYDAGLSVVVSALECCKLEVYRRVVAPREDLKCKQNGDVFSKGNLTYE